MWLCRSLGVTHISHRRVGRSSVIWERTLGHLLCLPFRASAAQMHTHTRACAHTHARARTHTRARTCTHMCMCTHTHVYTHAHVPAGTHAHTHPHIHTHRWACTVRAQRMGTLSKSVCKLLLHSFSLDFSAGVRCQYSSGSWWSQRSPSPRAANLHPPNSIGSSDILLVSNPLRSSQRLGQSPF